MKEKMENVNIKKGGKSESLLKFKMIMNRWKLVFLFSALEFLPLAKRNC